MRATEKEAETRTPTCALKSGGNVPEHFTESQIGLQTSAWCRKCSRMTRHRIDRAYVGNSGGKIGPCMEHGSQWLTAKQKAFAEKANLEARQRNLFNDRSHQQP
jgi:hypothetical protein